MQLIRKLKNGNYKQDTEHARNKGIEEKKTEARGGVRAANQNQILGLCHPTYTLTSLLQFISLVIPLALIPNTCHWPLA